MKLVIHLLFDLDFYQSEYENYEVGHIEQPLNLHTIPNIW